MIIRAEHVLLKRVWKLQSIHMENNQLLQSSSSDSDLYLVAPEFRPSPDLVPT